MIISSLHHLIVADLGFPAWLRASHWINVFFIGLLVRSGIQILASYPRLFWRDDCTPGHEWLKFTRRKEPTDRLWTSLEDEQSWSPVIAQPGGNNLGLGRHFHFFSVVFWLLNGVIYVILLFATGEWQRLIPHPDRRGAVAGRRGALSLVSHTLWGQAGRAQSALPR